MLVKERNYKIDLLKIYSMFLVVLLHAIGYGLRNYEINPVTNVAVSIIKGFACVGVNCFVLITGYYMSSRSEISCINDLKKAYSRLIPLWFQIAFYSIFMYVLINVFFNRGVKLAELIRRGLPILSNQYWFATQYFLLVLISPFINLLISNLSKHQYKLLLLVSMIIFSATPIINIFDDPFGTNLGCSLIWFVILYLVSGYIRKFGISNRRYGWLYIMCSIIIAIIRLISEMIHGGFALSAITTILSHISYMYNSPLVLFSSLCLFCVAIRDDNIFLNRTSAIISNLSALTFGVYLIHESNDIRDFLWHQIVHFDVKNPVALFFSVLCWSLIIFTVGIAVDGIRFWFIELVKRAYTSLKKKIS